MKIQHSERQLRLEGLARYDRAFGRVRHQTRQFQIRLILSVAAAIAGLLILLASYGRSISN